MAVFSRDAINQYSIINNMYCGQHVTENWGSEKNQGRDRIKAVHTIGNYS